MRRMKKPAPAKAFVLLALSGTLAVRAEQTTTAILRVLEGDTPIIVDEVTRQSGTLKVSTDSVGRARFEIDGKLSADEALTEARIRVWPKGQSEPQMDATAKVVGEYIFWGNTGEEPGTMKVPAGTLLYIPPSATAMEQTVRHAVAVRENRDSVALKIWSPYKREEVNDAEVRFPKPGVAELSLFGATYTLSIDEEGNILEGRVDPQGHTIVRE